MPARFASASAVSSPGRPCQIRSGLCQPRVSVMLSKEYPCYACSTVPYRRKRHRTSEAAPSWQTQEALQPYIDAMRIRLEWLPSLLVISCIFCTGRNASGRRQGAGASARAAQEQPRLVREHGSAAGASKIYKRHRFPMTQAQTRSS